MAIPWSEISKEVAEELERAGVADRPELALDRAQIETHAREIAAGRLSRASNLVPADTRPAGPGDVEREAELAPGERRELAELGAEAIRAGRVAVAVLNGGMATRFGGEVKGIVAACAGKTFLEIKLAQARRLGRVPFLIMNSFATHARTAAFLASHGLDAEVEPFLQSLSLRLTPSGEVLREESGRLSPYAPGHGDFPAALRRAGLIDRLAERGVETVLLSNIDNLGAELDPLVIGLHLARGRALTAELAETLPGDVGGTPAFVGGRLEIVEGFRFPPGFDPARIAFLATNTFAISLELLAEADPQQWYYVEKDVPGGTAVQMERLVNELTRIAETTYLVTPRSGPRGRFFPIKLRADLEALQRDPELVRRFSGI